MKITLKHENGHIWEPRMLCKDGLEWFVLSNKNAVGFPDKDGRPLLGNREQFHILIHDVRSALNALHAGLSIRMTGIGNNGETQQNLFNPDRILIDGKPLFTVCPETKK